MVDDWGRMPRSRVGRTIALLAAVIVAPLAAGVAGAQGAAEDDPALTGGLQWSLDRIGAPKAWRTATGKGTTIAIVDSGADLGHEDLISRIDRSVSCLGANGDPDRCGRGSAQDDNGHGTHVSGVAGAATDNGRGIAGVAPGARLMIVRVLQDQCSDPSDRSTCTASGTAGDVAAGIRWAADHGADVINLSLGGGAMQSVAGCAFCDAVEYAWDQGSIPVVAAGNEALLPPGFSDEPAVLVTATTRSDEVASYSSQSSSLLREARWPVAAPGGEAEEDPSECAPGGRPKGVLSTYYQQGGVNGYACLAGTSMAAPHVAGALAVLRSEGRSPQEAIDRLLATADDLGPPGRDASFGYGRIDLARAVGDEPAPTTTTTTTERQEPTTTTTTPSTEPPTNTEAPSITSPTTTPPATVPQGNPITPPTTKPPKPNGDGNGPGNGPGQGNGPGNGQDQGDGQALPETEPARPRKGKRQQEDEIPTGLVVLAALLAASAGGATGMVATRVAAAPARR